MNPDPVPAPVARPRCGACGLPLSTCLCALAIPTGNRVDVLVLQHPDEVDEAKGTLRLLRLSLARCRVVVGEVFDAAALQDWLQPAEGHSALLYPAEAGGAAVAVADATLAPTRLVVLDGTWRKSLKMLRMNPLLQDLPRWTLASAATSRYGAVRKARRATQLSTLEATCAALGQIESAPARYAPLLSAFDRFVAAQLRRAARR